MSEPAAAGHGLVVSAAGDYLNGLRAAKRSPHTIDAYRRDLLAVSDLVAGAVGCDQDRLELLQLTGPLLRQAFGAFAEPRKLASVHRGWTVWNQFLNFCVAEGLISGNPMPAVPRPHAPRPSPKPLRGEDTPERLLRAVAEGRRNARDPWPERDLAVLSIALITGLRLAELVSLTLASIVGRPGERRIQVIGKGSRPRSVPIEEPLHILIERYLATRVSRFGAKTMPGTAPLLVGNQGQALRRGGLQYLVRQCYRHAGVGGEVPEGALVHALRHVFATRLAEDGATASEIATLLGHASLTSAQHYIDTTAQEQRSAARTNRTYSAVARLIAAAPASGAGAADEATQPKTEA